MTVDYVLFQVLEGERHTRKWVCIIRDEDHMRYWRSEQIVGESTENDDKVKDEVMDEAFAKFHADISSEL